MKRNSLTCLPAVTVAFMVAWTLHAAETSKLRWVDIQTLNVEGKGWTNTDSFFCRLPAAAATNVPPAVYNLSKQTAGMLVRFFSDATTIEARWSLTSPSLAMPHMPATGVSGLDFYVKEGSKWRWVGIGIPKAQTNTATLISNIAPADREFLLYLPLYNGVRSVEIGVNEGAKVAPAGPWGEGVRKPIVFYGTSITQGGCASRPGMVHTAIIGRRFNWPVINLGFSGAGKMEMELADLMCELDAAAFVLDCLPNMSEKMLTERFEPFVRKLRQAKPNTPIVFVEDRTFSNAHLIPLQRERHAKSRAVIRECYQKLRKEGFKNLHYIKGESLLGNDDEGTVDGSHPTDLGFVRQADAFAEVIGPILKPGKQRP